MANALDELCPTCKAIPGHPCRDPETNRAIGTLHKKREGKALRRLLAQERKKRARRKQCDINCESSK